MRRFIDFTLILLLAAGVSAQTFPKPRGAVNDYAGVISSAYEQKMEALAREVLQKTHTSLVVLTVKDMGGLSEDEYANRLFRDPSWGIGFKGEDKGVLFLLSMQERRVRIETGYGVESILPDGLTGEILDRYVVPDLKQGNAGRGLYRGMLAVADVVAKDAGVQITGSSYQTRQPYSSRGKRGSGLGTLIIFIILMIVTRGRILPWLFLGAMMGGGRGGYSGGGGFGGGFGGFGGGMSGGGGSSRGF